MNSELPNLKPQRRTPAGGAATSTFRFRVWTFGVRLDSRPHEIAFAKTYHFPAYTKLAPKTEQGSGGDFAALEGTEVEVVITANQAVASGELRLDCGKQPTTVPLVVGKDRRLTGRVPMAASGTYRVHLVAAETGFENKFSPEYEVRATPDLPPVIEFAEPGTDIVAPANEVVKLVVRASDDCRQHKGLQLHAWVMMDNHFHAILAAPDLSAVLRDLKSFTAKQLIGQIETERREWLLNQLRYHRAAHKPNEYQVWQEGSHPQAILDDAMMRQKMEDLHNNPVQRGWGSSPEHWRFSSAHAWLPGAELLLPCDPWNWQPPRSRASKTSACPSWSLGTKGGGGARNVGEILAPPAGRGRFFFAVRGLRGVTPANFCGASGALNPREVHAGFICFRAASAQIVSGRDENERLRVRSSTGLPTL